MISLEQLKEAIADLKGRRGVLERQIGHFESEAKLVDDVILPTDKEIDEFVEAAKIVVEDLKFPPKQVIIQGVVDTVVATQRQLRVRAYLPIRKEVQNVKFHSECGNCRSAECGEVHSF